ncbi:MAG: radical SAM family heme chaperone HemW [Pseudomonadota bacterium]
MATAEPHFTLPLDPGLGLYVHLPWCIAKCPYCDFNSHPIPNGKLIAGSSLEADYAAALLSDLSQELATLTATDRIHSVFFGGGTPSLFGPNVFARVLDRCAPWLTADAEITLEANPGTQEYADFTGYRSAGINRVSLGAQSFDPTQLKRLGRVHAATDTQRAIARIRSAGFDRLNIDIMYALPEQSVEAALADLEQALASAPEHVSWYQLTLEPKTVFGARPPPLPEDGAIDAMEQGGYELLAAAGYDRYEVSAYARPGEASSHNLRYWTFGDYLAVGAGAHGKRQSGDRTLRYRKASQPRLYLQSQGRIETQVIDNDALPGEFAMNTLRLVAGVPKGTYGLRTGQNDSQLHHPWRALVEDGLMHPDRFATTDLGFRYLNNIVGRFVA